MSQIRVLFGATLISLCTAVAAQDHAGRGELGQCYSDCGTELTARIADVTLRLHDQYWETWHLSGGMTQEEWDNFLSSWNRLGCFLEQDVAMTALICRNGCADLERTLGTTTASARSIFIYEYSIRISELRSSGLWPTNYRQRPLLGSAAFDTACSSYIASPPIQAQLETLPSKQPTQ